MYEKMNEFEMQNHLVGEPISLAAVMTILCAAIIAVVVYRMFMSSKGSASIPGGWKFTWN